MTEQEFIQMQTAVYVMAGGGFLGRFAAEQPSKFYIDTRARTKYGKKDVMKAVGTLAKLAKEAGYNPASLPAMPHFHNLGVF